MWKDLNVFFYKVFNKCSILWCILCWTVLKVFMTSDTKYVSEKTSFNLTLHGTPSLVPGPWSSSLFQVVDSWSLRSKLTFPVPPCFESTPPQSKDDSIDSDACERISRHVCKLITEQTMQIRGFPRRIKIKVIIKHERNIFWCQLVFWSWLKLGTIR